MRASHEHILRRAALKLGAAFALCVLLVFGLLWPVPLSFAADSSVEATDSASSENASEPVADAPPSTDEEGNVVVEAPGESPTPEQPSAPDVPQPQTPVAPDYENAWPIGVDEATQVIAELWADGTFVVDGAGDTLAFESAADVPWLAAGVAKDITRVIFADDVSPSSMAYWFEGCSNLETLANVPQTPQDFTRTFYGCPQLVELPDDFALAATAITQGMFGLEETPEVPVETRYRGTDENVLAYEWTRDGRVLVNPDAPLLEPQPDSDLSVPEEGESPDATQDSTGNSEPNQEASDQVAGENATPESNKETPVPESAPDTSDEPMPDEPPDAQPVEPFEAPVEKDDTQVNITVPSRVSMMLGEQAPNTATIPVMVANRSERSVAITGARLKRLSQDLPGGSWSLTTEGGATTFVQEARFTPLGLEVTFERPVVLAAGDAGTNLYWQGTFSDFGMKKLTQAIAHNDGSFVYGSMIWVVSAL